MTIKKTLCLSLLALTALSTQAKPITADAAADIARQQLKSAPARVQLSADMRRRMPSSPLATEPFYVFNRSEGEGFVIVSGDDQFPAVIGYSDECSFPVGGSVPVQLADFLEAVSAYVADVQNGTADAPRRSSSKDGTPVVAPLIDAKWDQGAPFNECCPTVAGESTYVGCVATAMAQVMYKWKWPEHGRNSISYDWGNGRYLSVDFSLSTYDWASMKTTTRANQSSRKAREAVSKLSYDCGVASHMQYGTDGSGTTTELGYIGLYRHLGYRSSLMHVLYRDCFEGTQEAWNDTIKQQLQLGRPIIYTAQSSTNTGGQDAGHCFVIDGYDSNDFVHVNWGWGGSANGYYAITLLDPDNTGYTFSEDQAMIIDIVPDYDGTDDANKSFPMKMYDPFTVSTVSCGLGRPFQATISRCFNASGLTTLYDLGIGLYDKHGHFIRMIQENNAQYRGISIQPRYGISERNITGVIPANCADGDYVVRFMSSESDMNLWVLPNTFGGQQNNWVPVMIQNGTAYFNQVSAAIASVGGDDSRVRSTDYFDLQGRRLSHPSPGSIVVRRQQMSDGSVRVSKFHME